MVSVLWPCISHECLFPQHVSDIHVFNKTMNLQESFWLEAVVFFFSRTPLVEMHCQTLWINSKHKTEHDECLFQLFSEARDEVYLRSHVFCWQKISKHLAISPNLCRAASFRKQGGQLLESGCKELSNNISFVLSRIHTYRLMWNRKWNHASFH